MSKAIEQIHMKLENGTVIRHKVVGYEGRIDGVTEIGAEARRLLQHAQALRLHRRPIRRP